MFRRTSPVFVAVLICCIASSASAQTLAASATREARRAAAQTVTTPLNKPLWYGGAAVLGGGIGLIIGSAFNSSGCDDYHGFGLAGSLYEDECSSSNTTRMLGGAALASGGALMMLLARPKQANVPSVTFGRGSVGLLQRIRF